MVYSTHCKKLVRNGFCVITLRCHEQSIVINPFSLDWMWTSSAKCTTKRLQQNEIQHVSHHVSAASNFGFLNPGCAVLSAVPTHKRQTEMRPAEEVWQAVFALGFKIRTGWLDHKWTAETHRHLKLCHLCWDLINVKGSSVPLLHPSVTSEETDSVSRC